MKKLSLLLAVFFLGSIAVACAIENDTYSPAKPDSDATQVLEQSPTEAAEPRDDASEAEEAASAKEDAQEKKEVFIPKKTRHVWKDEKTVTGENGSSTTTTSNTLTDKLNKISGGGSTQS